MSDKQPYEDEHGGVWGRESHSWICDGCGTELFSPSDFDIVDGEYVCTKCLSE